jgi:hypothetical protein
VAVIAGSADLGSVTALWRQPAAYARFLDQELSQIFSGPVLVVMPNGLGFAGPGSKRRAVAAALARPRGPRRSIDLVSWAASLRARPAGRQAGSQIRRV